MSDVMPMKRKSEDNREEEAMVKLLMKKKKLQKMADLGLISEKQFEDKIDQIMDEYEENSGGKPVEEQSVKKIRTEKTNTIEDFFNEV